MNSNPIIFYNHFHNGDLFNSKSFVDEIMKNVPVDFYYAHNKSPKILQDFNLTQIRLEQVFPITNNDMKVRVIVAPNATLVNTWIGAYFEPDGECTLRFSYGMYEKVYAAINDLYKTNLKLNEDQKQYFPFTDYSKFDLSRVNKFLSDNSSKRILFCNGPALSNQCLYNGDMSSIIVDLAKEHRNISFIATHKFECSESNVFFTDDIIAVNDCDLNEIAYLSEHCDLIVGRSSGPFSFSCNRNNINDSKKTFLCFGDKITDCFMHGTDTSSKFVFEKFSNLENLTASIKKEINVNLQESV